LIELWPRVLAGIQKNRRRIITVVCAAFIIFGFAWFLTAMLYAWNAQLKATSVCPLALGHDEQLSYIQYDVNDQGSDLYFRSHLFISLGSVPTGPSRVEVLTSDGKSAATSVFADLFRDEPNRTFWMRKPSDEVPLFRESGSPHDFPFDSTTIKVDTRVNPNLTLRLFIIRNLNPAFIIPCETANVTRDASGVIHARFQMRRNSLVTLMATVILISATLFVIAIPFSVTKESLPTSVASFFFSIWSVRGILSSETKVFPTRRDIAILCLCVLLLLLIGVRLLRDLTRRRAKPGLTH